jgi:hypothetical protein
MRSKGTLLSVGLVAGCGVAASMGVYACSSSSSGGNTDAGKDGATDATKDAQSDAPGDSMTKDSPTSGDSGIKSLTIESKADAALQGAPGDTVALQVVLNLTDGTTSLANPDDVKWLSPTTVVAQDPDDAGANVIPDSGDAPNAFFILNNYRITHQGVLYIVAAGTSGSTVTVTASYPGVTGTASTTVDILPAPTGNAANGQAFFQGALLGCYGCHGPTADGSPPVDGGTEYKLPAHTGTLYPYPAPPLNNTSSDAGPNLAADPTWSAGLLGMAAQGDMDNNGVALRAPMPVFLDKMTGTGTTFGSQTAADIYAWLLTQTE